MKTTRYPSGLWAVLMLLGLSFFVPHRVQAATPGVVDNARILQAETVSKVSEALGELKQKYKKDILIETYATIPADKKDAYKPEQKNAFFTDWAKSREVAEQVNGVYVLICMDPSHLQIGVGEKTQLNAFTLADRDALKQKLISGFKEKKYDETLREVPAFIQNIFATNLKNMHSQSVERSGSAAPVYPSNNSSSVPPASSSSSMGFGGIIFVFFFIILGVIAFSFIARLIFGGGAGVGQPGYSGGGGGGFFSSLLGGIGGAMAGNYLYDSFFRGDSHNSSNSGGSDVNAAGSDSSSSPWGDSSTDSSYSNDGGGFDSGGSDFGGGGGDSGGGGGGDF